MKKRHYYYFEAFCSLLVVGLGQVIKGEGKKGLIMLLLFYFTAPALIYGSLTLNGLFFILTLTLAGSSALALWLYSIIDALLK